MDVIDELVRLDGRCRVLEEALDHLDRELLSHDFGPPERHLRSDVLAGMEIPESVVRDAIAEVRSQLVQAEQDRDCFGTMNAEKAIKFLLAGRASSNSTQQKTASQRLKVVGAISDD